MGTLHSIADQRVIRDCIEGRKILDGADLVEFMVDDFKWRMADKPPVSKWLVVPKNSIPVRYSPHE